jgi:hypothetical protein
MDDWVVLTKTKTQLRKVIKKTHKIMKDLKLSLHPTKTYIGKIPSGFNFLGFYMDDKKFLPSTESIRRMTERATAFYEQGVQSKGPRLAPAPVHTGEQGVQSKGNKKRKGHNKKRRYRSPHKRDTSEYYVNEPPPKDLEWFNQSAFAKASARHSVSHTTTRLVSS